MEVLTPQFSLTSSPNLFSNYQEVKYCMHKNKGKKNRRGLKKNKEKKKGLSGKSERSKNVCIFCLQMRLSTHSFMDLCLKEC